MAEKKEQHYVPQLLLKNFTKDNKFYIFNLKTLDISEKPIPYYSQCKTKYMYGNNKNGVEDFLGQIEYSVAPIINTILTDGQLPQNDLSLTLLKEFIVLQYLRTEKMVDLNLSLAKDTMTKILPTVLNYYGKSPNNNIADISNSYIDEHFKRPEIAGRNVKYIEQLDQNLDDLKIVLMKNMSNIGFICSDHPVIIYNLYQSAFGLGVDCPGVLLFMTLSPKYMLMVYDYRMYDIFYIELNTKDVLRFNYYYLTNSRKILISPKKEDLDTVVEHIDNSYILPALRNYLQAKGVHDFIQLNIEAERMKKNKQVYNRVKQAIKSFKENLEISFATLNKDFIPYRNNSQFLFLRHGKDELSLKGQFWGDDFVNNYKKYMGF